MKAFVYDKKTEFKLKQAQLEKPKPAAHEVLIQVHSASINASDYRAMKMGMIPKSKIFGSAVSGVIAELGKEVDTYQVGDEVLADISDFGYGGFAEFVTAPLEAVTIKPSNISHEEAATIPVAATTAFKALFEKGNIQSGQQVLIVGAAGGVGTFILQMAKYMQTEVTAVCSTKSINQCLSLGADHTIDYTKEDITQSGHLYDLILAVNGNYSLRTYKRLLKPQGTYVMVGGSMSQIFRSLIFGKMLSTGGKRMLTLSSKPDRDVLTKATKLLAEGKIRAVIEKSYPFHETPLAFDFMKKGHAKGKVVVNLG